jgi:hypothetical protein
MAKAGASPQRRIQAAIDPFASAHVEAATVNQA